MGCVVNRSTAYLVAVSLATAGFRGQQKVSKGLVAEEIFGIDGYNSEKKKMSGTFYCWYLIQKKC